MKGEMTLAEMKALMRAFFDPSPMTKEEEDAAKAAADKMSDWQTMSYSELEECIAKEEAARSAAQSGSANPLFKGEVGPNGLVGKYDDKPDAAQSEQPKEQP